MSQEDAGAPLVEAPNQSAARAESVAEGFANYLYQRDLKQIEEQSLFQKRLAERHREDIVNVVKLLLNNQENVPSTATSLSAVTSASVQAQLEAIPSALPVPQNIINLNELSANPKVPFQSTRSLGGALEILNISCTEEKCPWRGPKEQYTEHLRRQHKLKPYRCLQLGCNRIFSFQESLKRHTGVRHRSLVQCFKCGRTSKDYNCLVNHYRRNHEKGLYQCSIKGCKAVFETKQQTYYHRRTKCPLRFVGKTTGTIATRSQANVATTTISSAARAPPTGQQSTGGRKGPALLRRESPSAGPSRLAKGKK